MFLDKSDLLEQLFQKGEFNVLDVASFILNQEDKLKKARAGKLIQPNDFFIMNHGGIYPQTMLIEIVYQTVQIGAMHLFPGLKEKKPGPYTPGEVVQRKKVVVGDILMINVDIQERRNNIYLFSGEINKSDGDTILTMKNGKAMPID